MPEKKNEEEERECYNSLTLWRPLLPYVYSYKASCARPGYAIISNFWHLGTLTLRVECKSAQMSKITNDGLIWSGTHMATVCFKGLRARSFKHCLHVSVEMFLCLSWKAWLLERFWWSVAEPEMPEHNLEPPRFSRRALERILTDWTAVRAMLMTGCREQKLARLVCQYLVVLSWVDYV